MDFLSTNNSPCIDDVGSVNISPPNKLPTINYEQNNEQYLTTFSTWNEHEQLCFVENLLKHMQSHQHGQVNLFLLPMLKRDFIGRLASYGLEHVAEKILGYLDDQSLKSTELVCREWYHVISEG
jgi:F-box and WD-40 domain protein 1/11